MKTIIQTSMFKKGLKKIDNSIMDREVLQDCITKLANGERLGVDVNDHQLRHPVSYLDKNTKYREFHPSHRIAVIYNYDDKYLTLYAIGTHKNLELSKI